MGKFPGHPRSNRPGAAAGKERETDRRCFQKFHIAWIVITETNAVISKIRASFGCLFPGHHVAKQALTHSLWSASFLLKSCPVVAEKQ